MIIFHPTTIYNHLYINLFMNSFFFCSLPFFFFTNNNNNSGHPLSHMVVGAAKIRAHQQQMAEFQQGLGAETSGGSGGGGGGNKSAPQLAVPPPRAAAPVSPGSPKTAERIAASPYARLQFLGKAPAGIDERGGGGGGGRKRGEKKKKKKMSKQEKEKAAIRRGTGPGGLDDVVTGMNDFNDHGGGGGHQMVETSQLGYVTEEDMSASASAHRDFLLQTLRNVREQLSNPSPLIIAGVEEEGNGGMMEDGSMMHGGGGSVSVGVNGGGSSYMSGGDVQSITLPLVGGEDISTAFGKKIYLLYFCWCFD